MEPWLLANHWPAPAVLLLFAPWVVLGIVVFLRLRRQERRPH